MLALVQYDFAIGRRSSTVEQIRGIRSQIRRIRMHIAVDVVAHAATPAAHAAVAQCGARIGRVALTAAIALHDLLQRIHVQYHLHVVARVFFFFDSVSYLQRVFQYEYKIFSVDLILNNTKKVNI